MAEDKKISQLSTNDNIDGTEEIVEAKNGGNLKNTLDQIKDWVLQGVDVSRTIDGGAANTVYLNEQSIDGGNA
jgi:hypothetical protein